MLKDVRHAIRLLWGARGWTAIVVLSLALGIGANTALFSVVNGMLLTSIPVKDPDTLVRFRFYGRNDMVTSSSGYGFLEKTKDGQDVRASFSYPMFQQFVADNQTMTDLIACAPNGRVNLVVDGQADIASAFISTGNYYQVLGINARIGRTILPEDDSPTAPPVAVISSKVLALALRHRPERRRQERARQQRAGHDRRRPAAAVHGHPAAGRNAAGHLAAACARHAAAGRKPSPPGKVEPPRLSQPTYWWLQVMGRLKPGVTAAQVQGNLEAVFQQTARSGPGLVSQVPDRQRTRGAEQQQPDGSAAAPRPARRARHLRRLHERAALGDHPRRGRYPRPADRLCERGQPAALARDDPAEGTVRAAVARRDALAAGAPAPDREPAARGNGRRARDRRRLLGQAASAGNTWPADGARLEDSRLRHGRELPDGAPLRHRTRTARHGCQRQLRAQGNQPERRRFAYLVEQGAPDRSGGDLARARRRRQPVSPHALQPAARRRRIQSAESPALPHQPGFERLRSAADDGALSRHARAPGDGARRLARWRCRRRRCSRAASTGRASSSTDGPTNRTSAIATTASTASSSRPTSSR